MREPGGKKGRSGRPGWEKTFQLKRIWDKSFTQIMKALSSKELTEREKTEVAARLISKMIPSDLHLTGELTHKLLKEEIERRYGRLLQYGIGSDGR